MAMATVLRVLAAMLSLLPLSSLALTQDFCVADLSSRDTPAGYPCKPQADVVTDDFFYGGLAQPGPSISPFNISLARAFVTDFPGVNGLDIADSRVDIAPGGVAPLHTHPEGSELLYLVEGTMVAGFISSTGNRVYMKTLRKGDLFVFPLGLLHFQLNTGAKTAVGIATYSNANPGLQVVDWALFKSSLPADVVKKITFLDIAEVERLKGVFGGSG